MSPRITISSLMEHQALKKIVIPKLPFTQRHLWPKFLSTNYHKKSVWPDRSLFTSVHHTTDQDWCPGSPFIVGNIAKSDEISYAKNILYKTFSFQSIARNDFWSDAKSAQVSFSFQGQSMKRFFRVTDILHQGPKLQNFFRT